jgi:hypothetical protein
MCGPLANQQPENKKPAGAYCASGSMSALCRETLCTPHRARRVAVMMMVAMRPRIHTKKLKKIVSSVNNRFLRDSIVIVLNA